MSERPTPTYWDYLQLNELLALQGGLEGDEQNLMPDELHFILVHQTMELWFKLLLRELRLARDHLGVPDVPEDHIPYVVHHMRRATEIVKLCVQQFQVVETLTPQDFLAFRGKLSPASGFQSFQMREIEILLGLEESEQELLGKIGALDYLKKMTSTSPGGALAWEHIAKVREEKTLLSALNDWIYRTPIQGSSPDEEGDDAMLDGFATDYIQAVAAEGDAQLNRLLEAGIGNEAALKERFDHGTLQVREFLEAVDVDASERERVRRIRSALVFIESYRELPLLAWPRLLLDTVVELEQQMVLFRSRHARMVERVIGRRVGTGGSSGVDYLERTTRYRIFKDLWSVRTVLVKKTSLPALKSPEFYGFAN